MGTALELKTNNHVGTLTTKPEEGLPVEEAESLATETCTKETKMSSRLSLAKAVLLQATKQARQEARN